MNEQQQEVVALLLQLLLLLLLLWLFLRMFSRHTNMFVLVITGGLSAT